jgi:hypothetical protein
MKKFPLFLVGGLIVTPVFADPIASSTTANLNQSESSVIQLHTDSFSESEIKYLKKLAEKEKLSEYSGVLGTAPKRKTVTATGGSLEETPSGPQAYVFWTQTLANGLYYEGRFYAKYNAQAQNPAFPDVQPSQEHNPNGYKGVFKLGYAFNVTPLYDITPYVRAEAGNNISLVYADTNGNYIHSTNFAFGAGFKQTFKLTNYLTPYIDISGMMSQVNLNGNLYDNANPKQGWSDNAAKHAIVNQYQLTTEFGAAYKITEHQSIIPYMQFQYNTNDPDNAASSCRTAGGSNCTGQNGFGVSSLTSTQQVYAIKYSYAW